MGFERVYFEKCTEELCRLIPEEEMSEILTQPYCEIDKDFLGFAHIYKSLSQIIPKDRIVIDFGCNLAAQSYFFAKHKRYIGVDLVKEKRFAPKNATHYVCSIQYFIAEYVPDLLAGTENSKFFAICSYVPDSEAMELVRKTFQNVFCYYPC